MNGAPRRWDWWDGFWNAIFLDVPYTLDSLWRFAELDANRGGTLSTGTGAFTVRSLARSPVFVQFAFVAVLFCFGPTLDSLCIATGAHLWGILRQVVGVVLFGASVYVLYVVVQRGRRTLATRYDKLARRPAASGKVTTSRRVAAYVILAIGALAFAALPLLLAVYQFTAGRDTLVCQAPGAARVAAGLQFAVVVACLAAGAWVLHTHRLVSSFHRFLLLGGLLAVTALALAGVAALGPGAPGATGALGATEASGGPYLHVFAVAVLVLLLLVVVARYLAYLCFGIWTTKLIKEVRAQVAKVELLTNNRPDPRITPLRRWAAFLNGVIYHPLPVLLLPAFAALFSPTKWMWVLTFCFAAVSVLLVMWSSLAARWQEFLSFIERWFFAGMPLVVSLAAIGVGFARLMEVQYVATVLDSTPFGFLFVVVIMGYAASWFVEYWTNRWVGERLLEVLGAPDPTRSFVRHRAGPVPDPALHKSGVVIALHGTGRLAVHGWYWGLDKNKKRAAKEGFSTYGYVELFRALGDTDHADNVARRVRLYFAAFNTLLALVFVSVLAAAAANNTPLAQLGTATAKTYAADGSVDLADLLVQKARQGRPALVVAASGGGTRAAIYTATALRGLAAIGRARDVVLVSGVSGGGVAAAYFADYLAGDDAHDDLAWEEYQHAMAEPFIQDVLDGSTELRIMNNAVLGELLKESFTRRLFGGEESSAAEHTFARVNRVGLLLNTTITGHPRQISQILNERVGSNESCEDRTRPFASLSGGRLVFTNLANVAGFPTADTARVPDAEFHFTVVRDNDVPLAAASALTANFPPVFPNARVILETADGESCRESYFVTDGGATENVGLISALYALRGTLAEVRERLGDVPLPDIHLIVIEASAITYDYAQDRGIGAATGGGKDRLAGGLTELLIRGIDTQLATAGAKELNVHYLALPIPFRSRGGLGTHWMFAETVRVSNPLIAEPRGRWSQFWRQKLGEPHYEVLDQQQLMGIWNALFSKKGGFCEAGANPDRVSQWICGRSDGEDKVLRDLQVDEWDRTIRELGEP